MLMAAVGRGNFSWVTLTASVAHPSSIPIVARNCAPSASILSPYTHSSYVAGLQVDSRASRAAYRHNDISPSSLPTSYSPKFFSSCHRTNSLSSGSSALRRSQTVPTGKHALASPSSERRSASVKASSGSAPTFAGSSSKISPSPLALLDPRKSTSTRVKELYAQLKFLFKFYFKGVKQIWRDRQIVQNIQKRCTDEGREMTWGESRTARTYKADVKKLPLFLAILLIVEELLPFVIIYAPFLLPSTCILPSQLIRIRHGEEVKRAAAIKRLRMSKAVKELLTLLGLPNFNRGSKLGHFPQKTEGRLRSLPELTPHLLTALNEVWKCLDKATLADLNTVFTLPTTFRPAGVLRHNLERHARFLAADDVLLRLGKTKEQRSEKVAKAANTVADIVAEVVGPTRLADFPSDLPTLSSIATERGLRATEGDGSDLTRSISSWTSITSTLVARRRRSHLVDTTPQNKTPSAATLPQGQITSNADALEVILLPLSLYPLPNLFTPSLVAAKVPDTPDFITGALSTTPMQVETTQDTVNKFGILKNSKEVVREVLEAEERKQWLQIKQEKTNRDNSRR